MAPMAPVRDHDDLTSIKSGKDGLPALSLRLQAFPRIAKSRFNRSPSPVACSFSQQPQNLHHITLTPQDEGGRVRSQNYLVSGAPFPRMLHDAAGVTAPANGFLRAWDQTGDLFVPFDPSPPPPPPPPP